jgi:hypothetical protein
MNQPEAAFEAVPPTAASFLHEVAARRGSSGGQIRNVVLHAAIQREYRKSGGICPLKRNVGTLRSVRG